MQNELNLFEPGKDLLAGLNPEQKKAVTHKSGPLLIIAGAGTGKTLVITRRIAHIIAEKWAEPHEILALTFTDKAAGEMEERVDKAVPYGFVDTHISTFHAFGDRLLRDYAIDLGLPANFKVLTATEQAIFMRQNLYAFDLKYYRPIANPLSHINELLKHFSRLKDELISPEEYIEWAEGEREKVKGENVNKDDQIEIEKYLELANAYSRYQELMLQAGNLDYGDQIYLTYKLLKENKKVLRECQNKFRYILVDEFQDTNHAQYQIVRMLSHNGNITVVGDDDQSIYRFRGASISNILSFRQDYPNCTQIVLNRNYRSTQEILDSSYRLILHNNPDRLEVQNKINKRLIASKNGPVPMLIFCDTLSCEADMVAKKILEIKGEHHLAYRDFAILARANNHLEPFIQALNYQNIPNLFVGSSSLFDRQEIKMLVSFFKCLCFSDDNLAFYQLATSELYNIGSEFLSKYYSLSKRQNKSFEELFTTEAGLQPEISALLDDIKKYRQLMVNYRAGEVLYQFLNDKKYFKTLTGQSSLEAEIKMVNIAKFFDRIAQFDHTASDKSVLSFMQNLKLVLSVGDEVQSSDIDPDIDAVNMMSVHASKGLEWPVVFVINMVSDRFPGRDRRDKVSIPDELIKEKLPSGDYHLQEERRLFYVACTRARDYLYFSAADDYGGKRSKKVSQFILECLDQPNIDKLKHKLSPIEKIERHKKTPGSDQISIIPKFEPNEILKLSRQQIDDYFTCPKKYYFASILKIPLPTNWHFMYGTAVHEAIGRFYARKIRGEKPDLKSLLINFDQSFSSDGFITREHEMERKRSGIETLTRFFEEDQKANLIPYKIEDSFEFSEDNIKVNGRYDLIIKNQDTYEIFDFKTSAVKDQKDADTRIKKSTQMMMYALAWQRKNHQIPKTTLYFIESNLKGERIFSEKELEATRIMILEVAQGIRAGDYQAEPDLRACQYCAYNEICQDSLGS